MLKRGFQKKLIFLAKTSNRFSWRDLAINLNTTEGYLKGDLFNERILLKKEVYNRLCELSKKSFDDKIIRELQDNWGRSKGGKNSLKKPKLLITKQSEELAELIGVVLGDGNIWIREKSHYYLTIAGDIVKDKKYLTQYVSDLIEKLFNIKPKVRYHYKNNEIFIYIGSKDVVYTLIHYGLKAGNKKKNNAGIPKWIFNNRKFLARCIRGLMDTDGCVCPITGRDYPYFWFSSSIDNLRKDFSKAMEIFMIKTSSWNMRKNHAPEIYIASREMISKYMEIISFKNERHLNKLVLL